MSKFYLAAASAVIAQGMQIVNPQPELFLQQEQMQDQIGIQRASSSACQFVQDYSWYSFVNTDYLAPEAYTATTKASATDATAYFTYCQELQNTKSSTCASSSNAAILVGDVCTLNAGAPSSTTIAQDGEQKFTLVYQNTDSSTNKGVETLNVIQNCGSSSTVATSALLKISDTEYETSQTSNIACPIFTANGLIQFVNQYKWFFGPGFIAGGIFFGFVGLGAFKVALFIVMTIAVSALLLFICYATFLQTNTEAWVGWTMLGVSVLLGLIAGFLAVKLEKFAAAILSGWGGFLVGVMVSETVLWLAGAAWLCWVINISFAIVFAILGFFFVDHAIVLATSFIGAYMMMKGIGIMAGGFPNIYVLIQMIESGAIDSIDPVFYAYMAGVIIMTIVCTVFQWKHWLKKKQEKEAHPYNNLN